MSLNNSSRALDQIVSVDGWIGEFDEEGTASVHADVVFREGFFGESAEDIVRFKVSLTRAEVVICLPTGEPIRIVRRSIRRTTQTENRLRQTTKETKLEGKVSGGVGLDNTLIPNVDANLAGAASAKKTVTEEHI